MNAFIAAALIAMFFVECAIAHPVDPNLLKLIPDVPSDEVLLPNGQLDNPGRIRRGRVLFNTPFGKGNNKITCKTCHEPEQNFTINQEFIATLPQSSPLFRSENFPELAFLENSFFLRRGLICENLDGFNMPCVFRSIPHTLGLSTSITPDAGTATRPPFPLVNATGWDGGGSPDPGSLLNFAFGAVVQHETGDQRRRPGVDFKVPSKQQLRQLLAFQLSLGQTADPVLSGAGALVFADPTVEIGKALFVNGLPGRAGAVRSCNACHNNAGARDAAGNNRQFATGVARHPSSPACLGPAPGDGGFGTAPVVSAPICSPVRSAIFRGDGAMNTPTLVNAADTPPWFHNGIIDGQIERTIDQFYTSDTFNNSPSGGGNAFVLNAAQVNQIGALLRAINARENVRNSIVVSTRAINENKDLGNATLREARSETVDAIGVLQSAPLTLYPSSTIIPLLGDAARLQLLAISQNGAARRASINSAISRLRQASAQLTV